MNLFDDGTGRTVCLLDDCKKSAGGMIKNKAGPAQLIIPVNQRNEPRSYGSFTPARVISRSMSGWKCLALATSAPPPAASPLMRFTIPRP